jgi:hypothetical protein
MLELHHGFDELVVDGWVVVELGLRRVWRCISTVLPVRISPKLSGKKGESKRHFSLRSKVRWHGMGYISLA